MYVLLLITAARVGTISVQRLGLGLGKYEAAFRENEIDETVLPHGGGPQGVWRFRNARSRPSH